MQYLDNINAKKLCVVYLKFTFDWTLFYLTTLNAIKTEASIGERHYRLRL